MKKIGKHILKTLNYVFVVSLSVLCLMEIAYRYQWIDFYKTEFNALNQNMPSDCQKRILVFGDSFSAQQESYVNLLRETHPETCIYNAAVPGTGIMQTRIIAKSRIEKVHPQMVIYQMYLGNDLIDIHHPINWAKLNPMRNLYWWLSDRFRVVAHLNHKLGQLSHAAASDIDNAHDPKNEASFSVDKYSSRTKLYLKSDSKYLDKSVRALEDYDRRIQKLLEGIEYLRSVTPKTCPLVVLMIPHCTQVNDHYFEQYQSLGAKFPDKSSYMTAEYDLLAQLRSHFSDDDITFINPLPSLRKHDLVEKPLYYANDPHLNANGHKVLHHFFAPIIKPYIE